MIGAHRHHRALPHLLVAGTIAVLCFWVYHPALQGGFVWDDRSLFEQNAHRWQWSNLGELLTHQDNLFTDHNNGFYRPLPNLSFLLDRSLWGFEPAGFHLTNLAVHTAAALVLYLICLHVTGDIRAGAAAALVFAVHPVNVESVAWINGRNNAMAGLFYLLAFWAHLRWRSGGRSRWLALACASLAGSILSKEVAVTFPLVVAAHEATDHGQPSLGAASRGIISQVLPYLFVLMGFIVLRGLILPALPDLKLSGDELLLRLIGLPHMVWRYLELLLCPLHLSALHQTAPILSVSDPRFVSQSLGIVTVAGLWIWSRRRSALIFFALGWVWANLAPVVGLIPIPNVRSLIAERYLYLASAGMALAMAGIVVQHRPGRHPVMAAASTAVVVLTVLGFSHLAMERSRVWTSEEALWQDTVEKAPRSFEAWVNLAIALADSGQVAQARVNVRRAIALRPHDDTAFFILGNLLVRLQDDQEAIRALETALSLNPAHSDARRLLATIRDQHANKKGGRE